MGQVNGSSLLTEGYLWSTADSSQASSIPPISGRIINDEIIEYDERVNHVFENVNPIVTSENGTWRFKFVKNDGSSFRISQLQVRETVSLGVRTITLFVSPKPKKGWF